VIAILKNGAKKIGQECLEIMAKVIRLGQLRTPSETITMKFSKKKKKKQKTAKKIFEQNKE